MPNATCFKVTLFEYSSVCCYHEIQHKCTHTLYTITYLVCR